MRSMMLKYAATWIASAIAWSLAPAARSGATSSGPTSLGLRVSFSRKPSVARSFSSIGAVRQSSRTALTSSCDIAFDATAP